MSDPFSWDVWESCFFCCVATSCGKQLAKSIIASRGSHFRREGTTGACFRREIGEAFQNAGLKGRASPTTGAVTFVSYYVADEAKNRLYLLTFFSTVDRYDALVRDFMGLVNTFEIK